MSQLTTLLSKIGPVAQQILGTTAPTILKAAGGPFGMLAGVALQAVFGTSESAKLDVALAGATPEQLLALRKAEEDFQVQMKTLGIQEEQLILADLASARQMQVATHDPTVARLAWLIIGGFLVVSLAQLVAIMGFARQVAAIPPAGWVLIGNISGYLANEAKQAAAFYFGSTSGSQAKDATIAEIAKS